jgi:hypothetical protein
MQHSSQRQSCRPLSSTGPGILFISAVLVAMAVFPEVSIHAASPRSKSASTVHKLSAPESAAKSYAEAVASGNKVPAGRLDFACQYRLVSGSSTGGKSAFPREDDPVYARCWDALDQAHRSAVEQREPAMDAVWPATGAVVFFREDFGGYAPSSFVMDRLGTSPPGSGLTVEVVGSSRLPSASFRLNEGAPVVAPPTYLVQLRITYRDALTSPIAFAPGAYQWTNTVKRPKKAIKAVTVGFVIVTGLKKLGFPGDAAAINLPVIPADDPGGPVPFVTERGGYVKNSAAWWEPRDVSGLLIASVGRAGQFPDLHNRVALLNRVLLIDPFQPEALTLLSRDLYETLLAEAGALQRVPVTNDALAMRVNQVYWDTYAQTTRTEISLGMEMGGFSKPTPADYLFRMIPAMENLAKVRPEDLENRIRLGIAYRWNNDQLAAIDTHEALVKDIPRAQTDRRARALIELAWSRIAKVAWNRILDDPGIPLAIREAEEAYTLTEAPIEKFMAAYTVAYGMIFSPTRDNRAVLDRLTDARDWYLKAPGGSPESWRVLLENDNVKGLVEADPAFQPLFAAGDRQSER